MNKRRLSKPTVKEIATMKGGQDRISLVNERDGEIVQRISRAMIEKIVRCKISKVNEKVRRIVF